MKDCKRNRRSGIAIMLRLVGLVKPLLPFIVLAVILGVIGYLCAIFITILAGFGIVSAVSSLTGLGLGTSEISLHAIFVTLAVIAVARGVLHYGEQYCNHFIAFKLLAIIRHKVFAKLRELCPAKLEGKDKGNLIAVITSDIELLEVFYAHTISPILIAFSVSVIMTLFIGVHSFYGGLLALAAYITVGVVIPVFNGHRGSENGMEFRNSIGELNSYVLESLYGIDEVIQYGEGENRTRSIDDKSLSLGTLQRKLSLLEGSQRAKTNLAIQVFSLAMLALTLFQISEIGFSGMLISTLAMMSSFGPVVALSGLSNNLNQTFACGERVLSLLEERPQVESVSDEDEVIYSSGIDISDLNFSYDEETIIRDFSISLPKGEFIGIHGASGSGKSTLLKLIMRFWDADSGSIRISDREIKRINTSDLRALEAYVTQETWLFHDTAANNIAIAKPGATRQEIEDAAKKASIHDFINSLPNGYDTQVGELGSTLSGGERQRIAIARAFLHKAPILLLDEPTSNLDSLNEAIILKALKESFENETVVLVSHRDSTMSVVDKVYETGCGRLS